MKIIFNFISFTATADKCSKMKKVWFNQVPSPKLGEGT